MVVVVVGSECNGSFGQAGFGGIEED